MQPRLFVPAEAFQGNAARLDGAQSHYLAHVLRLREGARLSLFDGSGREWPAVIARLGRDGGLCHLDAPATPDTELPVRIRIIQAAARGEKVDSVLQKATELGAAAFIITGSERAQLRLQGARRAKRLARWRRIVIEAAEQSGRVRLPAVQWVDAPDAIQTQGLAFALHPDPSAMRWRETRKALAQAREIDLAIGPEGGWSSADLAMLKARGFSPLVFGPRILRTETAAPALLAAIQALL